MIVFALSLPSTSHTICIGNNFHHVHLYIEIVTAISDVYSTTLTIICDILNIEIDLIFHQIVDDKTRLLARACRRKDYTELKILSIPSKDVPIGFSLQGPSFTVIIKN